MDPVEPYQGDVFDGTWAAEWVRGEARTRLRVYDMAVRERFLAGLGDPAIESQKLADADWDRRMAEPSDGSVDPADIAELATDIANDSYGDLFALRQAAVNLSAAGLYHLFEQTATSFGRAWMRSDCTTVTRFEKWLGRLLGLHVSEQPFWPTMNELRLLANAVKHGEGDSANQLREVNPAVFEYPGTAGLFPCSDRPVSAALAGEDLYVSDADLERYFEAVTAFWEWLGGSLEGMRQPIPRAATAGEPWTLSFRTSRTGTAWVVEREEGGGVTRTFVPSAYEEARRAVVAAADSDDVDAIELTIATGGGRTRVLRSVIER